jgi:hypothetical protein
VAVFGRRPWKEEFFLYQFHGTILGLSNSHPSKNVTTGLNETFFVDFSIAYIQSVSLTSAALTEWVWVGDDNVLRSNGIVRLYLMSVRFHDEKETPIK